MKVVINTCYGGFSLSEKACEYLGIPFIKRYDFYDDRSNPKLVECIETLGSEVASGEYAKLKIVEIPDNISWYVHEYDGHESIYEEHRHWS